jgi:ribose 1,5-bisphosphate isomerase
MLPAVKRIIRGIKTLRIQGSTDISESGVEGLKIAAKSSKAKTKKEFIAEMQKVVESESKARITEPALRNALKYVMVRVNLHDDFKTIKEYTQQVCDNYLKQVNEVVDMIADIGSEIIDQGDVILTHCHSENVTEIFKEAKKRGKNFKVIVTETRPMYQGIMTAKELSKAGIETVLVVDAAIGFVMKDVKKVLVGCDAIFVDGSIVNKIGTFPIAVMAMDFGKPFYVAGGTYKFATETVMGKKESIEMRDSKEVWDPKELPKVEILNPAFDVTPAKFIKDLITEKGMTKPEWIREITDEMFI